MKLARSELVEAGEHKAADSMVAVGREPYPSHDDGVEASLDMDPDLESSLVRTGSADQRMATGDSSDSMHYMDRVAGTVQAMKLGAWTACLPPGKVLAVGHHDLAEDIQGPLGDHVVRISILVAADPGAHRPHVPRNPRFRCMRTPAAAEKLDVLCVRVVDVTPGADAHFDQKVGACWGRELEAVLVVLCLLSHRCPSSPPLQTIQWMLG